MAKAKSEKDVTVVASAKDRLQADADAQTIETTQKLPAEDPQQTLDEIALDAGAAEESSSGETEADLEVHMSDHDDAPDGEVVRDDKVETASAEQSTHDTQADPDPVPSTEPEPGHSGIWPAVFGGVIAALLGFIAGRGDLLDSYLPVSMQRQVIDLAPIEAKAAALAEADSVMANRLDALAAELAAVPEPVSTPAVVVDDALAASVDALRSGLVDLTARLDAVEAQPAPAPAAPAVDNSEEIVVLQSALSDLQARLSEDEARARTEAERTLALAALTQVVTAVDSGAAFEPALDALEAAAPVSVPDVLRSVAAQGVPTMAMLREGFPEAARAGLAAARAEVPESEVEGIGGFLRRQLSARSVVPREGSDPDAVLSRVEAAMKAGDLDTALGEADALPDAAKSAMQDWLGGADIRKAASDATKSLADSLTVN